AGWEGLPAVSGSRRGRPARGCGHGRPRRAPRRPVRAPSAAAPVAADTHRLPRPQEAEEHMSATPAGPGRPAQLPGNAATATHGRPTRLRAAAAVPGPNAGGLRPAREGTFDPLRSW